MSVPASKRTESGFQEFDIVERGKPRHIQSVKMAEKCVQSSISNNCLIPILEKSLIFDNGASLKGKGTDFAISRFVEQLRWHYNRYGLEGGIYFFDFSAYFSHINHKALKQNVRSKVRNAHIMEIYDMLIDAFRATGINSDIAEGIGLGSQVSQISAVFFPNQIDHWVKDVAGIHGYGRYMDDGYIIHHNLDELRMVAEKFEGLCVQRGIILNLKKCRIIKLSQNFRFLKIRFFITDSGKIVRRVDRTSTTKERKKLKKLRQLMDDNQKSFKEINLEFHSWLCGITRGQSYYIMFNMIEYFNNLFADCGGYEMPSKKPKKTAKEEI